MKNESTVVKKPFWKGEWRRRYRVELLLFLLLWSTFAYFYQSTQQNEAVRFDQTRAIVQDHTLAINKYSLNSADVIHYSRDGQDLIYPNKAPGTSLLAVPHFLVGSLILKPALAAGLPPGVYWHLLAYATIIFSISLLSALAATAMFLVLKRMTADVGFSVLTVLAIWLGTLVFPFSTLFFSHALAAALLTLAFYLLFRIRYDGVKSVRQAQMFLVLAGILIGFSVTTEYPTVLLGAILTLYALWIISRLETTSRDKVHFAGAIALGLLIGGGILIAYNVAAFGKPIYIPYEAYAKPGSPFPTFARGFLGLRWPGFSQLLSALAAITIHPPLGILYLRVEQWALYACNPVLWLALPGLGIMLWRSQWRAEGVVIVAMIVAYLLFITNYGTSIYDWGGAIYLGSRHIVPLLPFLALPLHCAARKLKWLFFPLFALSVFYMLIATAVEPRVNYHFPVPARDVYLPDYLRGRLAQNSESLFEPTNMTKDSTAFNLAKLAGIPGRYQLAPLMLWWFAIGSALLLASRPHKVAPVSPQSDNGITKETKEGTTELQIDQPAVNYFSQNYVTRVGLAALFIFVTAIAVAPVVHYKRASTPNNGSQGSLGKY